jgi:hypothetical protein
VNESTCKSNLMKRLRAEYPHAVCFRHEDRMTHGVPDLSVTMDQRTSWWEVKYATPGFESPGIQELTLKRLGKTGYAYYIIFEDVAAGRKTYIVDPEDLLTYRTTSWACKGFDYTAVVTFIARVHGRTK